MGLRLNPVGNTPGLPGCWSDTNEPTAVCANGVQAGRDQFSQFERAPVACGHRDGPRFLRCLAAQIERGALEGRARLGGGHVIGVLLQNVA